ncbi:TIGR03013 family XrtA/PEP-CTERM system glycosyltransferase [Methylomarinum sp. Ch1-1]|uniref:TIGR03013 family XrtA/PEP-CTERM system glycosyltransferase n=1 Tax=Methylomarinum roseum TaxID=3067653 RepID=A0AAU7NPM0_9GAMM|nr:TIGR03013 family XrtA/PEP-CTERM system glycosyltransferase [Methylomarinum sp. Ch1-1]MDP4521179.1 TIGR03013 family PEP-CTERM/XrtA system glycosyltransferase [Methylomarinum sp. Ch1-1]
MIRIFRHYISGVYLGLFLLEYALFFLSMRYGHDFRFMYTDSWYSDEYVGLSSIIFATVLSLSNIGIGLYRRSISWNDYKLLSRVGISFTVAAIALIIVYYAIPAFTIARSVLVYALAFSFVGMLALRYLFYRYVKVNKLQKKILVIGAGQKAKKLINSNDHYLHKGFQVCGCMALEGADKAVDGVDILTQPSELLPFVRETGVDEIVVAIDDRRSRLPMDELLDCKVYGVDVVDLLTFYEREKAIIDLENLYPSWFIFSDGFAGGDFRAMQKRLVDILASLFLLAVSWPFMLAVAIAIMLESRFKGPILYRQTRVGELNENFEVMKFRSMRTDAEMNGARMASENDDRVTKVGAVIRKYRLDELPQIWNVLRGDMSFVGPRPERPQFVDQFAESIPYYRKRHRVKPGITGWAQLCYPYGANEYDAIQKLQYDLYYVKNYSLFLDLIIIIHTVEVILWGKGAR